MKAFSMWFFLSYFLGCSTTEDVYYEEEVALPEMESEHSFDADEMDIIESTTLYCVDLGMDEYDIPKSAVVLAHFEERDTVGKCNVCQEIDSEDFASMDIPENALSACGGWFAGGGDYFYCIKEGDDVVVYTGWQDEGQMEEDDFGYHWKKTVSITYSDK